MHLLGGWAVLRELSAKNENNKLTHDVGGESRKERRKRPIDMLAARQSYRHVD